VYRWVAEGVVSTLREGPGAVEIGTYCATYDVGVAASIALWQEAIREGPDFASPRLFPWTLASSAAAFVAAHGGFRGPCYTLVGSAPAVGTTLVRAIRDLARGRVAQAAVFALDMGTGERPEPAIRATAVCLVVTGADAAPGQLEVSVQPTGSRAVTEALLGSVAAGAHDPSDRGPTTAASLARTLERAADGHAVDFHGTRWRCWT
jgi:hypothetical protein